ncbi:MAG: signal recognition particle-docking protein FtsY, partial [Thaumarchaeota archaeon]|nr:signal recognition particle-docking protein FtsY [Nitrososphaerota archaeon]
KKSDDPFEGINDNDISQYADLYDVPPPENDNEAFAMGEKIRKWIANGRPKPGQEPKTQQKQELEEEPQEDKVKEDKEEKSKKKGLFGWLKK